MKRKQTTTKSLKFWRKRIPVIQICEFPAKVHIIKKKIMESHTKPRCRQNTKKCGAMLKLVAQLNKDQKRNLPGKLGPVHEFKGRSFFEQFEDMNVNKQFDSVMHELHETPYKKIFPIGDVHGDLLAFLNMLYSSNIINKNGDWSYDGVGPLLVVQLGDALDRKRIAAVEDSSDNPREEINIIEYMYMLSQQAKDNGHTFISLSGNHEHMAITGKDHFAYKAHQTPFSNSNDNTSRTNLLQTLGARRYLSIFRPIVLTLPSGWIITHGLVEKDVADYVKTKMKRGDKSELHHFMKYVNFKWAKYVMKVAPKPPAPEDIWHKVMWARPNEDKCGVTKKPFSMYKGQIVGHTINDTKPDAEYKLNPTCERVYQMDFAMSDGFSFLDQKTPPTGHFFDI